MYLIMRDILETPNEDYVEEPVTLSDSRGLAGLLANGSVPPMGDVAA